MEHSFTGLAVLWDMDGVLVDTGDAHFIAWRQAFAEVDYDLSREAFVATFGKNNDSIMRILFGEDVDPRFSRQVSERKEVLFREMISGSVVLMPDVQKWLAQFQAWGVRQAVASSAPVENIDALVDAFDIRQYFDALVSGGDLPGKPNPDVFLKAAEAVGVPPEKCVVIEDAVHGVEGAKAGGMKCIAVTTTNPAEALADADLVLKNLTELDEAAIRALIR